MNNRGHRAGVPVLVADGTLLDGVHIVAPTMAAAGIALQPQAAGGAGGGLSPVWWVIIATGVGLGVSLPFILSDES